MGTEVYCQARIVVGRLGVVVSVAMVDGVVALAGLSRQ